MAEARILYKTDHHHSFASRDLLGIFTSKIEFEKVARRIISTEIINDESVPEISEPEQFLWMMGFFLEKKQTQGLPDFELMFEVQEVNKLF